MRTSKKVINIAYIAIIIVFLLVGLVRCIISSASFLEYENRNANKVGEFSIESFLSGDFQDSLEAALSDQSLGGPKLRELFNKAKSSILSAFLSNFSQKHETAIEDDYNHEMVIGDDHDIGGLETDTSSVIEEPDEIEKEEKKEELATKDAVDKARIVTPQKGESSGGTYYSVGGGMYIYKDYVVQGVASLKANKSRIDSFINAYNNLVDSYQDINFYLYYIERDSDQNYATGYRSGIYDYINAQVHVGSGNFARQNVTSFEQYKDYNMKSDHHWGYNGSYNGYKDILAMLKPDAIALEPLSLQLIGYTQGSFTKTEATANFKDEFYAYEFDFPDMEVMLNGKTASDYGNQSLYIEKAKAGNNSQKVNYGGFYGQDTGEIVIHNPSGEGSILIFGNSYDNALIKLIASHYEYTYSVDLRNYTTQTGKNFLFAGYISTHPVDDVIGIGNAYFYLQSPFIIKP